MPDRPPASRLFGCRLAILSAASKSAPATQTAKRLRRQLIARRRDHGAQGHREGNRRGSNGDFTFGSSCPHDPNPANALGSRASSPPARARFPPASRWCRDRRRSSIRRCWLCAEHHRPPSCWASADRGRAASLPEHHLRRRQHIPKVVTHVTQPLISHHIEHPRQWRSSWRSLGATITLRMG